MSRFDFDPRDSDLPTQSPADVRSDVRKEPLPPMVRPLDERARPSAREQETGPSHTLTLPTGPQREPVRGPERAYLLRGSEVDLLEAAGRFRAVLSEDLVHAARNGTAAREDIRSLIREGLLTQRTVTRLRSSASATVVTLTPAEKRLLDRHRDPAQDQGQTYYTGWVKRNEVWHDASLFRVYRQAAAEIEADGGRVRRVVLDDELKARAYRSLNRDTDPAQDAAARRRRVAMVHQVPVVNGRLQFPDVRLEIEDASGERRTVDLELVTEHYHRGHISGKSAAGFRLYRGDSSRSGGTPREVVRRKRGLG